MEPETDWKTYERAVHNELLGHFPDALILSDVRLPGHLSRTDRKIDILIEETLSGIKIRTAVDAKHRPLDVKHVEAFIGMLRDIRVDRGLLVSMAGYTQAG